MERVRIIRESRGSYVIQVYGEDHTLGTLLVEAIKKVSNPELAYYETVHPMEDIIQVYVKYDDDVDIKEVLRKASEYLLETIEDFRKRYLEALESGGGRG
ncbi:RpoL/Rpb11 RNA polymerase subunit family protein [Aeropyrum camini]|uniref:DNA-directed RNA polymerase subunit Rpo11 n=1 Tax=Aeropyrum camini SY1 = JCM 12091 TaxID=1198449 RepID=U3T8D5_9CREN|nr:RpoL/Rpb11 RNA polymerase subunit family protein [Aeropyrum camini]BAN89792.1 DNA-directed RNA polymerase subunit L [Aeropyrum camini SY1 = JCM 12091]